VPGQPREVEAAAPGHGPVTRERKGGVLHHGASRVPVAGFQGQVLHADVDIAHALHHRAGQAHILAPGQHFGVIDVVEVVRRVAVVLHDEARLALFEEKT
jgi:hypothetical protein